MLNSLMLSWAGLAAVWLAQAGAPPSPALEAAPVEAAPRDPGLAALEPACDAVVRALGDKRSLAVPAFLVEGGTRDRADLEGYVVRALGRRTELRLVPPSTTGIPGPGPHGLQALAARLGVEAALGVTLVGSPSEYELLLLLVDAQGQVLLDTAFPLGHLPPPAADLEGSSKRLEDSLRAGGDALRAVSVAEGAPVPAAPPAPPASPAPGAGPGAENAPEQLPGAAAAPEADPRLTFEQRKLELQPAGDGWRATQAGKKRITDLELCLMGGRPDLVARVERELDRRTFRRDLGVGLTLAGVVLAGLTVPFFKAEDDAVFGAGIGTVGGGLAVAVAGAVLWGLYGPEADGLERGAADQHLLARDEADQLVRAYNDSLLRELGLTF
jgi:hypothetical protein